MTHTVHTRKALMFSWACDEDMHVTNALSLLKCHNKGIYLHLMKSRDLHLVATEVGVAYVVAHVTSQCL